jgi:prolyl oligopeptidase
MSLTGSALAPVEEMIHGVLVRDPYRWLEDRSLPQTEEWIREQQRRCDTYFAECEDLPAIKERVRAYLGVEVVDQPAKVGHRYFYRRRGRDQEQACIYTRESSDGEERLLVDPSPHGQYASVGIYCISPDGTLLAYEFKQDGGDRKSLHIVDVTSGLTLPDLIETGYARGFAFTSDRRGFLYCQERPEIPEDHTVCLHLFEGTEVDKVCFRVPRTHGSRLVLAADGTHLGAIHLHRMDSEDVIDFRIALKTDPDNWQSVFMNRPLPCGPILKHGRIFEISYDKSPNGKLIELNQSGEMIRVVIPEQSTMIRQAVIAGNNIIVNCLNGQAPSLVCWNLEGKRLGSPHVPQGGTVQLLPIRSDDSESIFYTCESFTQPLSIFEHNISYGWTRPWHLREHPTLSVDLHVRAKTYNSKDGTRIPLTLLTRDQADSPERGPVIMTAYGGFGVPMTPQFSVLVAIMAERGAAFALPNIRGGGEFGKDWHDAARGKNRQVAFDDFIAAAEWLCSEGIATPDHLGIFGGSNSGLLVGVAMTQRPDLFRAVLCIAPLLDMVRYERFDESAKWRHEYGTADSQDDFAALYSYSPYHRIEDRTDYPSVLFVSGDSDDRCNPAHVRKTAARLQERNGRRTPVVVDYIEERGHSPVLPLSVRIDALTRRIAFLCRELNIPIAVGGDHETICA